jgi:hypothetical protein
MGLNVGGTLSREDFQKLMARELRKARIKTWISRNWPIILLVLVMLFLAFI